MHGLQREGRLVRATEGQTARQGNRKEAYARGTNQKEAYVVDFPEIKGN